MQGKNKTDEDCIKNFLGWRVWLAEEVREWEKENLESEYDGN